MIVITAHGRLAHEPELKTGSNTTFCEFRLLSTRFAQGQEHVEAVTFICFGAEAERFCERVEKGQLISATGTQQTRKWTDASGAERTSVKYGLTWWEAGPRPNRSRAQEQAHGSRTSAQGQPRDGWGGHRAAERAGAQPDHESGSRRPSGLI